MAKNRKNNQFDVGVLSAVPILSGEPVLMGVDHARSLLARIAGPLAYRGVEQSAKADEPSLELSGNTTAIIPVIGVLTKYATWYDDLIGLCPATRVQQLLSMAVGNPDIDKIVISFDTPGGFVNGTVACADAIAAANKVKPVIGFVHGMCCSGGYWLASQCASIYARREAFVGNIGCYNVLADVTEFYESLGVKLKLITSGPNKGLGADGKVTDAFIAEAQRQIDGIYQQFVAAVCAGRDMSPEQVTPLADGRAFLGTEAFTNGLIDGVVSTFDDALQAVTDGGTAAEGANMAKQTPPAATAGKTKAGDKKDEGTKAPTNDDVRSSLTDAKTSADSHTTKARAAMDNFKAMTEEADANTKDQCKQTAASLKACAEESSRCAEALEGSEDDDDDDDDDSQTQGAATASPVSFSAQDFMSAFGNQGAVWFIEKKPFAAAATEFITGLKAAHKLELDGLKTENETLKTKLKSIDLGNPSASFNVAEGKAGNPQGSTAQPTARQQYASLVKMPTK